MPHSTAVLLVPCLLMTAVPAVAQPKPLKELPLARSNVPPGLRTVGWLAFSPDGKHLAARYDTGDADVIRLWDAEDWKERRWQVGEPSPPARLRPGLGEGCAFATDSGRLFLSAGGDVMVLDLAADRPAKRVEAVELAVPKADFFSRSLWVSATAGYLLTLSEDHFWLRGWPTGASGASEVLLAGRVAPVRETVLHSLGINSAALDPAGKRLVVGADGRGLGGSEYVAIEVWDVPGRKRVARLKGHEGHASCLAFSPDGTRLASGSDDGSVKLWDVASGEEVAALRGPLYTVSKLAFSADGKRLAYVSYDRGGRPNLRLVDGERGTPLAAVAADDKGLLQVCISPKGDRVATHGSDDVIRVWDVGQLLGQGK